MNGTVDLKTYSLTIVPAGINVTMSSKMIRIAFVARNQVLSLLMK